MTEEVILLDLTKNDDGKYLLSQEELATVLKNSYNRGVKDGKLEVLELINKTSISVKSNGVDVPMIDRALRTGTGENPPWKDFVTCSNNQNAEEIIKNLRMIQSGQLPAIKEKGEKRQ